jgi:hypothetical protein
MRRIAAQVEPRLREDPVERPRAADDFEVIRERLEELRREREEISSTNKPGETPGKDDSGDENGEGSQQECREAARSGAVPTIFLPQPTD